ncbi:MAG TPA: methyltransferase domain-containing protein [bacterium]|nr:methyltransferase domain-containing protein [bacterium]
MSPLLPQPQPHDEEHPRRLALLPAAGVLGALALKPGQRFLDVDCGVGAYFFPVFEAMQGRGVFLAAHLDEDRLRRFLTRLEGYSSHPGYSRVEVVRSKPDRLPLPEASADRVLLQQAFHRLRDQRGWLKELRRVLAPGGLLCLLDWKPGCGGAELGPEDALRIPEAQAAHILQEAGFSLVVSHTGFQQHWCLTARR